MRRLRSESGFTLIELLVAATVGIVVLLAALTILDSGVKATGKTLDRLDSAQSSRQTMQTVAALLHSQVCLPDGTAAFQTTSNGQTIRFYGFIGNPLTSSGGVYVNNYTPSLYELSLNTGTHVLTEKIWNAGGAFPAWTFPDPTSIAPNRSLTLATQIYEQSGSIPLFRYYSYSGNSVSSTPLATPLSAGANAALLPAVMVRVAFTGKSRRRANGAAPADPNAPTTNLEQDIVSPTIDPNASTGPKAGTCG
jgi:type II secretory pathway pseudopilin PulG